MWLLRRVFLILLSFSCLTIPSLNRQHQHIVTSPNYIPLTTTTSMEYIPSLRTTSRLAAGEIPPFLSARNITFFLENQNSLYLISRTFPSRHPCYMPSSCVLFALCKVVEIRTLCIMTFLLAYLLRFSQISLVVDRPALCLPVLAVPVVLSFTM